MRKILLLCLLLPAVAFGQDTNVGKETLIQVIGKNCKETVKINHSWGKTLLRESQSIYAKNKFKTEYSDHIIITCDDDMILNGKLSEANIKLHRYSAKHPIASLISSVVMLQGAAVANGFSLDEDGSDKTEEAQSSDLLQGNYELLLLK